MPPEFRTCISRQLHVNLRVTWHECVQNVPTLIHLAQCHIIFSVWRKWHVLSLKLGTTCSSQSVVKQPNKLSNEKEYNFLILMPDKYRVRIHNPKWGSSLWHGAGCSGRSHGDVFVWNGDRERTAEVLWENLFQQQIFWLSVLLMSHGTWRGI